MKRLSLVLALGLFVVSACLAAVKPAPTCPPPYPDLEVQSSTLVTVMGLLRTEGGEQAVYLADRIAELHSYCGGNGDFRVPWALVREAQLHLAAPSALDALPPAYGEARDQVLLELKAAPICPAVR